MFQLTFFFLSLIYAVLAFPPFYRFPEGSTAVERDFPWQVALYKVLPNGRQSFTCGGALISDTWILTAAHCIKNRDARFAVRLGITNVEDRSQPLMPVLPVMHPRYDPNTSANDIALLKLVYPVMTNKYIQPIRLADETLGVGVSVTVSGWGSTTVAGGPISSILQYVDLHTISNEQCSLSLPHITPGQFCAVGRSIENVCNGDSGGPLVTGTGSRAVHVGVVSFGSGRGCEKGLPSAHTRTSVYRRWIAQITGI